MRVAPEQLDQLLHPQFDPKADFKVLTKGMNASPGAAVGKVVFSAEEAVHCANKDQPCILVRWETTPDDLKGMVAAEGIPVSDEDVAEEIKKTRRELNQILSDASGQPIEKVQADTERDNYLTAAEALDYGLIDRIVTSRDLAAKDA